MLDRTDWLKFKLWAKSHTLHHRHTKLPLRLTLIAREELVDFIHGSLIGMFIGLMVGMAVLKLII